MSVTFDQSKVFLLNFFLNVFQKNLTDILLLKTSAVFRKNNEIVTIPV